MSRPSYWITLLLICIGLTGCVQLPAFSPLTTEARQLAQGNNAFGFDLLAQLRRAGDGQNLFFSPLSLALALQMVYNGASPEIAGQAAAVLHLPSPAPDALNEANRVLQASLRGTDEVELLIANSIWLRQGFALVDAFASAMATAYNAEIAELDFDDPATVERINAWVDEQTRGEISEILQEIPSDTALYLINAIYFKGDWQEQFDPKLTQDSPFTRPDGSEKTMPMMRQSNAFPFYQGPNFQLAALPYGGEGRVQLVVLLPDEATPLDALLADLDLDTWQQWVAQLRPLQLSVVLPRFEVEYTNANMLTALEALGLPAGGYTGVAEGVSEISRVMHKAIVKVNEEGTVAAAVTVGEMAVSEPPSFIVDRPFFFTIQDGESGAILFMGAIVDPEPLAE